MTKIFVKHSDGLYSCNKCFKVFDSVVGFINHKCLEKEKLMTRSEVIALYKTTFNTNTGSEMWIDFFVKTGMLEVEKEISIEDKLSCTGYYVRDLIKTLDKVGLKIVEK